MDEQGIEEVLSPKMMAFDPISVATIISERLASAVHERGRASLAIPGGRSPASVLIALAAMLPCSLRENLHLMWVDERYLPVGHKNRNDTGTLAAWHSGGPPPKHIHPMPADTDSPTAAAKAYSRTILDCTGNGIIDVCLLGVGEDGHIASLFPGHQGLHAPGLVTFITDSPKPPPQRLTMTLTTLSQARCRLVMILGESKRSVVKRIVDGKRGEDLPASLLPLKDTCLYFSDQ